MPIAPSQRVRALSGEGAFEVLVASRRLEKAGLPALRDAIATSLPWRGVRGSAAENVVVVPGAKPMIFYALLAVLEPGDEVLVPDPGFPIYPSVVRFAGAVPVRYPVDALEGGAVDVERLAALIGPRTRALV